VSHAGAVVLDQLQIIFVDVDTVRQQRLRFENAVIA